MKTPLFINIEAESFEDIKDLPKDWQILWEYACEAAKNAYAPYSRFFVGAACQTVNGNIVTGNNQENAAYPSGLCAERVCIFHASSITPNLSIQKMAVAAYSQESTNQMPASPCGSCRQTLLEYELRQDAPLSLLFYLENRYILVKSVSDLLPMGFGKSMLL